MQRSKANNLGGWELGGWMNTPKTGLARSTKGVDIIVERHALGEVAMLLFRELTSQKSAAKTIG
jgi:hypothetical protein